MYFCHRIFIIFGGRMMYFHYFKAKQRYLISVKILGEINK